MKIERVNNGYIITLSLGAQEVYHSLDEVMTRILGHFEGLSPHFSGSAYGEVKITRGACPEIDQAIDKIKVLVGGKFCR